MTSLRYLALLVISVGLVACSSSGHRAPVEEHGAASYKKMKSSVSAAKKSPSEKDWRPQSYIIQKGDTLYSIAFNYGFDYHELAELNGIKDPNVIQIGQELRLFPVGSAATQRGSEVVVARPQPANIPQLPNIKEQPKVVKYAYNDAAAADIEKVQQSAGLANKTAPTTQVVSVTKIDNRAKTEAKPESKSEAKPDNPVPVSPVDAEEDALDWGLPTNGKLITDFSEAANRKGVDFSGKLGQPILASASGKVVYSGSGLRGYGKLIIIKHNKTYLSAYAHNDQILVKEGQSITRGQKIAEMGNTDADQVKLHFEVRRLGKPVDPAKYLPLGKS